MGDAPKACSHQCPQGPDGPSCSPPRSTPGASVAISVLPEDDLELGMYHGSPSVPTSSSRGQLLLCPALDSHLFFLSRSALWISRSNVIFSSSVKASYSSSSMFWRRSFSFSRASLRLFSVGDGGGERGGRSSSPTAQFPFCTGGDSDRWQVLRLALPIPAGTSFPRCQI